jgi:Transcriptional regulator
VPPSADRPLTFTQQARRQQLIEVTVAAIAEVGYARCSLQHIADAAGITKAAVIYHFPTRNALVKAAYDHVIGQLVDHVGARVAAAEGPAAAVEAYVMGMLEHLTARPDRIRMITEALDSSGTGIDDRADRPARWRPLADLIEAAVAAGEYREGIDARAVAVGLGGAIDGLLAEFLDDPGFDAVGAGVGLLDLLRPGLSTPERGSASRTNLW